MIESLDPQNAMETANPTGFLGYAKLAGLVVATTAKVPLLAFYACDQAADTVTSYRLGRKLLHETSLVLFTLAMSQPFKA